MSTATRSVPRQAEEDTLPVFPKMVSIVVPCLNEELVIGEFVDWCRQGLAELGRPAQILIIDSSTDRSAEIAAAHGAEVLRVPRRGLGRAYIDALPHIRGDHVILGDCDLTYDFRELKPFIDKLDEGHDLVMGSRFRGAIEPGAMPALHRYFGTPLTTWILNFMYGTSYSDIHCGMRALTRAALMKLELQSQSWEYASEMVLKAARLRLKIAEVPVRFYRDREGRLSHHRRAGWLSPWLAGWVNLRAMFLFAPDFFLMTPGLVLLLVGLVLTLALAGGPVQVAGLGFDLHTMLLGMTLATLGYTGVQMAVLVRTFYNFDPGWRRWFGSGLTCERGVGAGLLLGAAGAALNVGLLWQWLRHGFHLEEVYHLGVLGLLLIVLGFQTFTFTLLFQMIHRRHEGSQP
jgi:glycosyltransferase involved in cell wall biosynthesis